VPSAVYLAGALARRTDFLSVGTNDLTQYLLAVDRNNAQVASLYDSLHPTVISAVHDIIIKAHRENRLVSVCGEMAGDPAAALLLLGMGIDALSMDASSLPRVKWAIRSFTKERACNLVDQALAMEDETSIHHLLNTALKRAGLGVLVSA
jgi:phosphotransferase system enzyme I (PtsP)